MVLMFDENAGKLSASLLNDTGQEIYECLISMCDNPVCTCGIITLGLVSPGLKDDRGDTEIIEVEIDINKKSLSSEKGSKVSKKDLQFSKRFLGQFDDSDFLILRKLYSGHKNKITEESPPELVDADFDYNDVEENYLMYVYNDVLPYGDRLRFNLSNGMKYVIFDQYCINPGCSCTDTVLNVFYVDESGNDENKSCTLSVNYKKQKWEMVESYSSDLNIKELKTAVESQEPGIYRKFKKRHSRLRAIYASNKKRNYIPKKDIQLQKVGRNDPCPCGSGKKYKKCCLV